jgi:RNA polymerase sigma-70 factor (ECF subfamily)
MGDDEGQDCDRVPAVPHSDLVVSPSSMPDVVENVRGLCEKYWLAVYRVVFRSCRSRVEAEELTQEAFARALASQGEIPSGAYVLQIARNLVIDRWRAEQRAPATDPLGHDLAATGPGPEALTEAKEQKQEILVALDALPDRYCEVLRLRFQECLSAAEVGILLGMRPNAVRQLQFRAVEALRTQLGLSKEEPRWRI